MARKRKQLELKLHPKQAEVFNSPARFRVLVSGRRFGKTRLSVVELIRAAKKPNSIVWYICPSYRMARQIAWQMLQDAIPKRWIKKLHDTRLEIQLINGSVIALKGSDNPDALRGVGLDFVVLDEIQDITPDTWYVVIRPTLADTGGRMLAIGTPKAHALLRDLYDKAAVLDGWDRWQFRTIDSPFIPEAEIEQARRDMDIKQFRAEFLAEFVSMSGRVYHPFEVKTHVGNLPFNPDREIWVGQDFNLEPMAAVILQPQSNGEVWAVDEIVRFDSNTLDACNALEAKYWRYMDKITIFPDASGGNRQHARGESDLDIFRERGFARIRNRKKNPPVADRVNAVNAMLMNAKGEIRLKVDKKCKHLIKALEQVMYKEGSREVDKRQNIEHISDGLGYIISTLYPTTSRHITGISL